MEDDLAVKSANSNKKPRGKPLAKGYDPRRWVNGRMKKPADLKAAEDLIRTVIWDVLSETIVNPNTGEHVYRLRAMLRSMSTSRQSADKQAILDRIAGKVTQEVDVTSGGEIILRVVREEAKKTDAA